MKIMLTAVMAAMLLTGPVALADSHHDRGRDGGQSRHFSDNNRGHGRGDRHDSNSRRDNRHEGRDRDRGDRHQHFGNAYRNNRHWDNRHRDDRHWDGRRWNDGCDWRSSRYYSPFGHRSHGWSRGGRLPAAYFSSRYVVYDYSAYRVRRPPRGYHWVRVDSDLLLVAIATGLVVDVVAGY